jgi:capsular exopolysaccharide synthesis family protein
MSAEAPLAQAFPETHRPSGADPAPPVAGEEFVLPPILLQYWQAIVRWRLVIAGIILVSLAAGIIVTLLITPRYTARTSIEISREQKNVTNVEGLQSREEGRDLEFYATQYSLLKADSLAERVARKLRLADSREFFAAHGVTPEGLTGGGDTADAGRTLARREKRAEGLLLKHIDIAPVRTSRIVDIQYTSRSPRLSAQIANAWVQEFIGATMDRQYASTADARRFLEQRLNALRAKVEQSERDAVRFASSHDIVTLDTTQDAQGRTFTQRTLASSDLEALNQALIAAQAERIAAQSKAQAGSAANSPEVLNNAAIADIRARRAELAGEYAKLMVSFEPDYPAAKALHQQIGALDAALARETSRVARSRQASYNEALAREKELQARVDSLKANLDRQRRNAIQYNIYQREADTNRQLYDALLQRYKEIGVAVVGASNIAIVDPAEVPTRPSAPSMPLNLLAALLAGIALSALTVVGLEQIDEGFRSPADILKFLKVPLLGNVPMAQDDPLAALADPKTYLSEAYFSIRSTLAFSTTHGLPRSLAVSSTQPGEGKSTTAWALAEIIGRTGKQVLLIDGDLRSPSLHNMLGVDNEAGFANVLTGDDEIAHLIRRTDRRGLSLLSTGPLPPSPAELLSSDRLREVVNAMLAQFDHVIIDAPPVLGLADAPLVGRAVEGVVFVIEAERTSRRAARASIHRLQAVGAHLLGVIVTKVDASRHAYGYGYGYGYAYGYGYGDGDESRYGKVGTGAGMARAAE